jgi:hypothetical protein
MIAKEIGGIDPQETEARLERANTAFLWGEPGSEAAQTDRQGETERSTT